MKGKGINIFKSEAEGKTATGRYSLKTEPGKIDELRVVALQQ